MNTMKRILSCLVLGMFLFPACKKGQEEKDATAHQQEAKDETIRLTEEQVSSAKIETAKVKNESFRVEIEALGEVASDTDRLTQVRPDTDGTVKEIAVAVGDAVEAGQVLLRYNVEDGEEVKELKAEKPGVVVGLYAEVNSHIDPAVPLITIGDTSKLRCGLNVYEKDIARVRKGQSVRLKSSAYPDTTFEGTVTYISPRIDEESRTIKVRVDAGNTGGKLKFGMFITGRIAVGERPALVVPETALQNVKGKNLVFSTADNRAFMPREVEIGERSNGLLEIKKGLDSGESVVTHGSFALKSELSKGEIGEEE